MPEPMDDQKSRQDLASLLKSRSAGSAVSRIIRAIGAKGLLSPEEIARQTGLARSTVSSALAELRDSKIVVEVDPWVGRTKGVGRPVTAHTLNPMAGTCLGLHLGLAEIDVLIVDLAHSVVAEARLPLGRDYTPAEATSRLRALVARAYDDSPADMSGLLGVGVSVSGPVAPDGRILHSSILPEWTGLNVREIFEPIFDRPVFAENESNCAATAEMTWGAAKDVSSFVLFKVDLGVGGAIVQNGNIVSGAAGAAGEFGHMSIDPQGELCRCGNRGCLETLASFTRPLERLAREQGRDVTMDDAVALAKAGDSVALELIGEVAERAGWGLAIISAVVNPPLILVGGRIALAGEILMAPLRDAYEHHAMIKSWMVPPGQRTRIAFGDFIRDDSLRGAAGLVLRGLGGAVERIG